MFISPRRDRLGPALRDQQPRLMCLKRDRIADTVLAQVDAVEHLCELVGESDHDDVAEASPVVVRCHVSELPVLS